MTKSRVDYLSHRPFLLIECVFVPEKHVRSESQGWSEEPKNWQTLERPRVVDRVTSSHLREAAVIIDVMRNRLVKNRFGSESDADVLAHYSKKYAEHAAEGLRIFTSREIARRMREHA